MFESMDKGDITMEEERLLLNINIPPPSPGPGLPVTPNPLPQEGGAVLLPPTHRQEIIE